MAALLVPPTAVDDPVAVPRRTPGRDVVAGPRAGRDVSARPALGRDVSARPALGRDVLVDGVRALATLGVVAVHWLMPEATFDGDRLWVGNALGHGGAWVLTWVLQVLPLLFFAAGASAAYQHARLPRGRGWAGAVGARVRGVARPVAAFAGAWVVALALLLATTLPDTAVLRLARMAPQLLWFLAVWVALVALTPLARAAWQRWRWSALAVAFAAPLAVDALRLGAGLERAAWANVLLVWAVPFLLGVAYADDRSGWAAPEVRPLVVTHRMLHRRWARTVPVDALPRPLLAGVAVLAVGVMAALVASGPHPASMIGMPGDALSNLAPPTAPIVAQSVAQVAVVLLARDVIVRWARGRGRGVVGVLARRSMTVYLWHLTAMFVVVGGVLLGLHETLPAPWSTDWWASRPLWWGAFALVLMGLVRVFGRFEAPRGAQSAGSAIA
ncbi:acyltransferase family protein [Xylanimonas protaetiae]|uniref:Acyltransferase 3 domain-containing protein n=1 Tax=Xylanimonas protaetiae TaxID=2509457 RepID=A0A4P6F0Z5_9MICO|nr:acyltransferase family protein [Xylanimonas protaetiae]QAY68876.1 hypothetical protein ET471_01465 [Xylanimonas protaetiae]